MRITPPKTACACSLPRKQGGEEGGVPLAGSICTECGKVFFVPLHEIREENELYTCPPLP